MKVRVALGLAVAVVAVLVIAGTAQAAIPGMMRPEITARAESAIGTTYTWGGESWIPNAPGTEGPDCSGFVLKCWEAPRTMLYQEEAGENSSFSPRYTSSSFYYDGGPWTTLSSRSALQEGDALARWDGSSGHVVLYSAAPDGYYYPVVYEAPGSGLLVRRVSRYLGSEYRPKRRASLLGGTILLDNPTAKSTGGSDVGGNWTRSTSVAGYVGDDYQVQLGGASTAWSRWTPRLPTSGYYDVYLRWTAHWNRATNAKVTINRPDGQLVRYVNQQINNNTWVNMGRYYFAAGCNTSAGSVAIHATGADGYVVADSARFLPAQYY